MKFKPRKSFNYVNATLLSPHYKCSMCLEVFNEPTRLGCSHVYCKKCIYDWLGKSQRQNCPDCRQQIDKKQIGIDRITTLVLADLKIFCTNPGCDWQGKIDEFDSHLKYCDILQSKKPIKLREYERKMT